MNLEFDGDSFHIRGNQVAFVTDKRKKTVCCALTEEDFSNGEFTEEAKQEVRDNRDIIRAQIRERGYTIEEG